MLLEQIEARDRDISGLKLELRSVKTRLDKSDIEIVERDNVIDALRRDTKTPKTTQETSMYRSKRLEEVTISNGYVAESILTAV